MTARYDAVVTAHPALADRLAPLRAATVRHTRAFGAPGRSPSGSPRAATSTPHGAPSTGAAVHVPDDEKGARTMLADAERSLADRRATQLLKVSGELARLLASVSAAGAAHVYLLTEDGA
ncbi:hypothetical protein [Streptomyces sp. NPDC050560]|uniref:hypothetical protein n=1 Tax=Streptomyces sp. NPDC050560 TaxID=3365630 RepID=UPI00378830C4